MNNSLFKNLKYSQFIIYFKNKNKGINIIQKYVYKNNEILAIKNEEVCSSTFNTCSKKIIIFLVKTIKIYYKYYYNVP